jgi:hypothetical protein
VFVCGGAVIALRLDFGADFLVTLSIMLRSLTVGFISIKRWRVITNGSRPAAPNPGKSHPKDRGRLTDETLTAQRFFFMLRFAVASV